MQTELTGLHQAADPQAMPLREFIDEFLRLLWAQPTPTEILVERVDYRNYPHYGGVLRIPC